MRIHVGSLNPVKVRAVRSAARRLFGRSVRVSGMDVDSGVAPQPVSLGETLRGARRRAAAARAGADLGVGVEAGLFRLEGVAHNATVCAVTDGRRTTVGLGPMFELPDFAVRMILRGDLELGEALARKLGIPNPAREGGAIGVLTRGAVGRSDLVRLAALMALTPWASRT